MTNKELQEKLKAFPDDLTVNVETDGGILEITIAKGYNMGEGAGLRFPFRCIVLK